MYAYRSILNNPHKMPLIAPSVLSEKVEIYGSGDSLGDCTCYLNTQTIATLLMHLNNLFNRSQWLTKTRNCAEN